MAHWDKCTRHLAEVTQMASEVREVKPQTWEISRIEISVISELKYTKYMWKWATMSKSEPKQLFLWSDWSEIVYVGIIK